jgi:flagellar biosynthetic protein FliR
MNSFTIDITPLITGLLLSVRIGMVLFMTPLIGASGIPVRIRVLALLALSSCLVLGMHPPLHAAALSTPGLLMAMVNEVIWGGMLGFGVSTAFATFLLGGRVLDLQMGFGVATLLDPATRMQTPLLGLLLELTGIAAFLSINGHHMVLRALAASISAAPLGSSPSGVPLAVILAQFGVMFSLGMTLVGAAVAAVFLVDIGMSVVARLLPQANVFLLSIPVKIFAGLSVLALSAPFTGPVLSKIFESMFIYWEALPRR